MEADKDTDVSLQGGNILEVGREENTSNYFLLFNQTLLKVSSRPGGEVLDLNPKPVDTFYPSPRKAARATR